MSNLIKTNDWLSNSTYKAGDVEEYNHHDENKLDNEILGSSSDSEDTTLCRSKKVKKRKQKTVKRRKIIKHYLDTLPSISDEKCHFRKYVFIENMPKEDRSENYFVDLKGNSQISRYGSIYEKHVPKYRSQSDKSKSKIPERYYEKLKSLKSNDLCISIEKRLCDSHCICHQAFIPMPFDIEMRDAESVTETDSLTIGQVSILNETIKKDPQNIEAWTRLVNLQSESTCFDFSKNVTSSVVFDRKLMIVEKALNKNQTNLQLLLMRMKFGAEIWPADKLQKEWGQLIFMYNTNINVWRFYIEQMSRQIIGFSVEKVIGIYTKCFSIFFNIMSDRMKVKMIEPETVYDLCDLFADYCDYLNESGFSERATASWQAMMEYNLFSPANSKPKSSGNITDDPMLQSFHDFWKSSCPKFGNPKALGWAESIKTVYNPQNLGNDFQSELQQSVTEVENELINGNEVESQLWLKLEKARQESWWLPYTSIDNEQEDPDRCVPYTLVQPILITLHNPKNLTNDAMAPIVSQKAKEQLILLFLDYIGVHYSHISLQNEIYISRSRWHQLQHISQMHGIITPVKHRRSLSDEFAKCCFSQLKTAVNDEWGNLLSVLELSFTITSSATGDSWKQVLSSTKTSAKRILSTQSDNSSLWRTYANLLIGMLDNEIFLKSDKGRMALTNEASKIVQLLVQQTVSCSLPPNDKLHILSLSIDLITKKYSSEYNDTISSSITSTLCPAAHILSGLHSLAPPAYQTLASIVLTFTDVVNLTSASFESLASHWHRAIFFQMVCQSQLLDQEKFQEWVIEECLLTITSTGSSCLWSKKFLFQLSQLLESMSSYIGWYYRSQHRNECAVLRSLFTPITHVLIQIQTGIKKPILEAVISPKVVQNCIGNSSCSDGQRLKLRNFMWSLVASFETETETVFNHNCHASSLLLLNMEIDRLHKLTATDMPANTGVFTGRTERVISTFKRLIGLRCMHWRYRLAMWHSFIILESQQQSDKRDERTMGVFYRAIQEMPGQKSLYLAAISLVPNKLEEVTLLMKNNHVRICVPPEEAKLLIRIRQSKMSIK